jgi:hypothetical protein
MEKWWWTAVLSLGFSNGKPNQKWEKGKATRG